MNMQQAIERVLERQDLAADEMESVMRLIMTGGATDAQIGGFLIGLRMKGESGDEVTAAARVMRIQVRNGKTRLRAFGADQLEQPRGIALGPEYIYVSDAGQGVIHRFSLNLEWQDSFQAAGS